MTLKSGQQWAGVIACRDSGGALLAPTVGPVGTLYVNGSANVAAVTVSGTNPYSWSVTLPSLGAGDCVSMYVTATIDGVATGAVVAEGVADTVRLSDGVTLADDAITASKFDESTAFPQTVADVAAMVVP